MSTYCADCLVHDQSPCLRSAMFQPHADASHCFTLQSLYASTGYKDELAWAAAWLYKATGSATYLNAARSYYNQVRDVVLVSAHVACITLCCHTADGSRPHAAADWFGHPHLT